MTLVEQSVIRTLVVDDEPDLRVLLRVMLEHSGRYEVVGEAADGRQAIASAGETDPDLILLDLSMPRMDGLETLPHLRRLAPRARVVVLSGFAASGAEASALAAGAHAYLEKGLTPLQMLAALDLVAADPDVADPQAPAPRVVARPGPTPPSTAEVVARLAHDVKTPLFTATGALAVLRDVLPDDVPEDVQDLVRRAVSSLERVSSTLSAAIEHARSGHDPLDPREVPLRRALEEVAQAVSESERAQLEVRDDVHAFVDPGALHRVLTNLVDNALRYSDGPVEVRAWLEDRRAVIEVADRGPGLGPDPDRLFQPFVRGVSASREGSGLGLATAADLVRRANGSLSASDRPDGGTCFRLELPSR